MRKYIFFLLLAATILVWVAVFTHPNKNLKIVACDVGQGDAILAILGQSQVLIDGGIPNGKVINCLSRHLPFWDRKIELLVNTHPQLDHYGGLIDVVKRYKVETFMGSGLNSSSPEYQVLAKEVGREGVRVFEPHVGQRYRLGMMQLDIVWPTEEFIAGSSQLSPIVGAEVDEKIPEENIVLASGKTVQQDKVLGRYTSQNDPNDFSMVGILSFGNFDVLLTGDIGPEIIDDVIEVGEVRDIEYLKVPHHGSKNGLTKELLDASKPEIAVISVGKGNDYGHPHKEVIELLSGDFVKTYRTDLHGDIVVETDGEKYWVK